MFAPEPHYSQSNVTGTRIYASDLESHPHAAAPTRSCTDYARREPTHRPIRTQRKRTRRDTARPVYITRRPFTSRHLKYAVVALLIAAVSIVALPNLWPAASMPLTHQEEAHSTPKNEWQKGSVPALYQIDEQWSKSPYAGSDVRTSGCGPTCLAMVYIALTGNTDMDPASMAAFLERAGYTQDGMTTWTAMTDGAAQLGLVSEELPADAGTVLDTLHAGKPVICSMLPGDFTTTGHFIVLAGVNDDGSVIVHDPNSPKRTTQAWSIDRILGQCANIWCFSAR